LQIIVVISEVFHPRWDYLPDVQRIPMAIFEPQEFPMTPILPGGIDLLIVNRNISKSALWQLKAEAKGKVKRYQYVDNDEQAKQVTLRYKKEKYRTY